MLAARGYWENPDPESPFFDLKWCLKTRSLRSPVLQPSQTANHYSLANECLTTKYGLKRSMQALKWHYNVDQDTFYPRCYDVTQSDEWLAFTGEFKLSAAQSVLRRAMADGTCKQNGVPHMEVVHLALQACQHHLDARDRSG